MLQKTVLKKYYSKLIREGIIKSLICGLIAGFSASIIAAFISILLEINGVWLSFGAGVGTVIIFAPIFYFFKFRPAVKTVAARLDGYGLEERVITMTEFEGDSSYIAARQRIDAKEKLDGLNPKRVKLAIGKIPIIAAAALAAVSISMTAASALLIQGDPATANPPPFIQTAFIRVSYVAETGGYIAGEAEQFVVKGEDTFKVKAIADEGYVFSEWSDKLDTPERFDTDIVKEFTVTAVFVSVTDEKSPADGQNTDGNEQGSGTVGGGQYIPNNQIIDGQTYYRKVYQVYYEEAMRILSEGGQLSDELRQIIEKYFSAIQ